MLAAPQRPSLCPLFLLCERRAVFTSRDGHRYDALGKRRRLRVSPDEIDGHIDMCLKSFGRVRRAQIVGVLKNMGDHIDIAALAAACTGPGIAVDTLPRQLRAPLADDAAAARPEDIPLALTDAEWAVVAPLPPEPPHAEALSQRDVVGKVIWVIAGAAGPTGQEL